MPAVFLNNASEAGSRVKQYWRCSLKAPVEQPFGPRAWDVDMARGVLRVAATAKSCLARQPFAARDLERTASTHMLCCGAIQSTRSSGVPQLAGGQAVRQQASVRTKPNPTPWRSARDGTCRRRRTALACMLERCKGPKGQPRPSLIRLSRPKRHVHSDSSTKLL